MIWIETDCWLIENEKIGLVQKRIGQTDSLSVTFGERTDQFLFHFLQTAKLPYIANALRDAAMRYPFECRAIIEVFRHPHIVVERHMLGHVTEVRPRLQRLLKNVEPGNRGATGSWRHKAGQYAHGGGLARTVRPQKTHDLALTNFEIQVLDRRLASVTFGQIFNPNHFATFP